MTKPPQKRPPSKKAATQSVMELKGIIAKPQEPVSLDDMDAAIARGAKGE